MLWEGASLWMLEGAPANAELQPHAHHAIQISICLKGSFEIGLAGATLAGPVAIVGSDTPHSFRANGAVAFLFVAPESAAGLALRAALPADAPWAQLSDGPLADAADALCSCLERGCPKPDMLALGRSLMAQLPAAPAPAPADARVLRMIDFARNNLEGRLSLPAAAAAVHLSTSRARHLFVEATGLPFKTYVLWLRLERAVALYAEGRSLTEAAHDAGFADSAHFSRTFRRTFGLPAAGLRLYHD